MPVEGELLREVSIAPGIAEADSLVVVSHFKGHELAGFGGALEEYGHGLRGKGRKARPAQHPRPVIDAAQCIGCGPASISAPRAPFVFRQNRGN